MLNNLFGLDGTPVTVGGGATFPSMSPGDEVSNTIFSDTSWESNSQRKVRKVKFSDVAFPKSLNRLTFTDCTFEDCLFLGTHFNEVEFHGCKFINCNLWKAKFRQVYLDPATIQLDERFKVEAANAGISVFQALLANFADERQDQFYMLSDIRFRRWKRYQMWSDIRRKRLGRLKGAWNIASSLIYEGLAGFGYKPFRFFMATLALFFIISIINYNLIGDAISINGVTGGHASVVDAIFYTFSILTVLGFSSIVPASPEAKLLTVFEALAAIGWLSIFTSILVKRFLR